MKQNLDTLILNISFLTLHQINPIFGYRVKEPQILTLWFDGLVLMTPKGMTIVCRSYVIGHKFINPTLILTQYITLVYLFNVIRKKIY